MEELWRKKKNEYTWTLSDRDHIMSKNCGEKFRTLGLCQIGIALCGRAVDNTDMLVPSSSPSVVVEYGLKVSDVRDINFESGIAVEALVGQPLLHTANKEGLWMEAGKMDDCTRASIKIAQGWYFCWTC